jgi:hypothetical protein
MAKSLALVVVLSACAPIQAEVRMPNPARTPDRLEVGQSYEIGPFRADHRYELTLTRWTPTALDFRIHLINAGDCGFPSSYQFTLVDDQGRAYALEPRGSESAQSRSSHSGGQLHEATFEGEFAAAVGPQSRFVVVKVRPRRDRSCSALDFRWSFDR